MDRPEDQKIYKCWVELHRKSDGDVRRVVLEGQRRIHIPAKKIAPKLPDETVLLVMDGPDVMEGPDIDSIAMLLRLKYPDEGYDRFLKCERDEAAEMRKAQAMDQLIESLANAVAYDLLRKQAELKSRRYHGQFSDDINSIFVPD